MGYPVLHTEQLISKQREIRTRLMPGPLDEEGIGGSSCVGTHRQTAGATRGSRTRGLEATIPHNGKTELTRVAESFKDKMTTHCVCTKAWIYVILYSGGCFLSVCPCSAEVCWEELACDHGKVLESLQSTVNLAHHVHY